MSRDWLIFHSGRSLNTCLCMCAGDVIHLDNLKPGTVYLLSVAAVNRVGVGKSFIVPAVTANLR